jgi:signal transduction histidine kinase
VELTVANDGPVIDQDRVEELFEPFHRGRHTRGRSGAENAPDGAGLGLSSVRAIARAHDGEVAITPRPAGGLSITLRLPAHPEHGGPVSGPTPG